jgi:hypothetical protein
MKIELKTTSYQSGIIEQELLPEDNNIGFVYTKWIVDTREKAMKEALIAIGWRPPNTQMQTEACHIKHRVYANNSDLTNCPVCDADLPR